MSLIRADLAPVAIATPSLAAADAPAGTPAFDPHSLRGTHEDPITQVLTIGSPHLAQLEKIPTSAELDSLFGKLEPFRPAIITDDGL